MGAITTQDRRQFVRGAAATSLLLATRSPLAAPGPAWTSLGAVAKPKGISFGFALNDRLLATNQAYRDLVAQECTIAVPENILKWTRVHPDADRYDFAPFDAMLAFATDHSIKMRGHCFCWHRALPKWVSDTTTKDNAESVLRAHIAAVAGRYKGKLHSWDVANEVIQLGDKQPDGWRNSFWYQMLGPSYVDIAFHAAHEADPNAILTYNDYGLEYQNHTTNEKRVAVLAMLTGMKKRGVPIGALGLQSHFGAGRGEKFGDDLTTFVKQVRDLGLKIFITEMDVDDHKLTVEGEARDPAVADLYKQYLDVILATADVAVMITWGAWDIPKPTGAEPGAEAPAQRPLLFDNVGKPKTAAFAVAQAFRDAPLQK